MQPQQVKASTGSSLRLRARAPRPCDPFTTKATPLVLQTWPSPPRSTMDPLKELTQLTQTSLVREDISRASCCGSRPAGDALMYRTVTPWSCNVSHGNTLEGKSPSARRISSPCFQRIPVARMSRPKVALLPRMMSSGFEPVSRPMAVRSRTGTPKKSSSRMSAGRSFCNMAARAASAATRGRGPWWAVFSHIRPSKGPKSCPQRSRSGA